MSTEPKNHRAYGLAVTLLGVAGWADGFMGRQRL